MVLSNFKFNFYNMEGQEEMFDLCVFEQEALNGALVWVKCPADSFFHP